MGSEKEPKKADSPTDQAVQGPPSSPRRPAERMKGDPPAPSAGIPDLIRRAMALGLSGFFTTEEAIRKALGDTLPRDWVDFAADQSERARSELTQRMTEEFGRVMEKVELLDLVERLLEGRTIEITAQIRLGEKAPRDPSDPQRREGPAELRLRLAGKDEGGE